MNYLQGYSDKELKLLKETELEILQEILRITKKHNIKYFTMGGTTLGAIRHGGFIPWDDDIDIGMFRDDYDKFMSVVVNEINDKYFAINYEMNKNFPSYFTKVIKKGTLFVEEESKNLKYEKGIFVDIFPFDNLPDDEKLREKQKKIICRRNQLFKSKILWKISNTSSSKKSFVKRIARVFLHIILIPVPRKLLYKRLKEALTFYNLTETKFVCSGGRDGDENLRSDFFPTKQHKFENLMVEMPNNYDVVLKKAFGNYMELPPVEKRRTHKPVEFSLGKKE